MLEVRNGLRRMLVALCWGAALLSPPVGLAHNAAEPAARDTLRVGYFALEGFNQQDAEGRRSGYGYDLLRLMSRYLNVKFEYVGYDKTWPDMLRMLESGEVDFLTSARKTPKREALFD